MPSDCASTVEAHAIVLPRRKRTRSHGGSEVQNAIALPRWTRTRFDAGSARASTLRAQFGRATTRGQFVCASALETHVL